MNTYEKNIGKFWKEISNSELICYTTHYIGRKGTQLNTVDNEFVTIFYISLTINYLQVSLHHLMEEASYRNRYRFI